MPAGLLKFCGDGIRDLGTNLAFIKVEKSSKYFIYVMSRKQPPVASQGCRNFDYL